MTNLNFLRNWEGALLVKSSLLRDVDHFTTSNRISAIYCYLFCCRKYVFRIFISFCGAALQDFFVSNLGLWPVLKFQSFNGKIKHKQNLNVDTCLPVVKNE